MNAEIVLIVIALTLLGLIFGSFAGAQVWRLRKKQLEFDKKSGEEYDKTEYKKLQRIHNAGSHNDRSVCLQCGHTLAWYDLLPIFSWVSTRGRCRYCRSLIGVFEPIMEISMVVFFILSYVLWPYGLGAPLEVARFCIWLLSGIPLAILFAYDYKWSLLPDRVTIPYAVLGGVYATVVGIGGAVSVWSIVGSIAIMSGLYLGLYLVSRGKWIGFGDVKLGVGLGLFLVSWELALLALFLANLIGTILVLPSLVTRKLNSKSPIPFGPMLIIGTIVAVLVGPLVIQWYLELMLL